MYITPWRQEAARQVGRSVLTTGQGVLQTLKLHARWLLMAAYWHSIFPTQVTDWNTVHARHLKDISNLPEM